MPRLFCTPHAPTKSTYTWGTPCQTPSIAVNTVLQNPTRKIPRATGPATVSSRAAMPSAIRAPPVASGCTPAAIAISATPNKPVNTYASRTSLRTVASFSTPRQPAARICYLSCEAFVNDYISAVGSGTLEAFRHRYRQLDVLLIDDIQFLSRTDKCQEEFFHTFNALYNAQKQVVLSSDSPPSEIPALPERLISRFQWGLDVCIDKPSFETRCAIVRKKVEERGLSVPEEVSLYVATLFDTNVRELEGAVTKLISLSALRGRPIDMGIAQEAFRGQARPERARVGIADIQGAILERFGLRMADLQSKRRLKSIAFPRQVCMYLARKLTNHSFEEIGSHFGGRDHTTVLYACQQIEERRARDQELDLLLEETVQKLKNLPA